MSEHFTVYFKSADGVHPVKLPATEALQVNRSGLIGGCLV
jgi:hypothetical protein